MLIHELLSKSLRGGFRQYVTRMSSQINIVSRRKLDMQQLQLLDVNPFALNNFVRALELGLHLNLHIDYNGSHISFNLICV